MLAATLTDRHRFYFLLLDESGVRCDSEALKLRWEDVDLTSGHIHVVSGRDGHHTKTHRSRYVPMTARLLTAAREYFAKYRFTSSSPYVFGRVKRLNRAFEGAVRRAGIRKCRQHDLRHRRVTRWLAEGQPIAKVAEAMGHASVVTTERYTHLVKEHLSSLVTAPAEFGDTERHRVLR